MEGKLVVKTTNAAFNSVSSDMKLEQTINRSQKSSGGIVGQTKTDSYISEWELVYHEILAISNCYSNLTKSNTRTGLDIRHELSGNITKEISDHTLSTVEFILARGNPYQTIASTALHNFTSAQKAPKESTGKILNFFEDGKQRYEKFRNERLVEKSNKLSHTITKRNMPKFEEKQKKPKTVKQIVRFVTKKTGAAQKIN